jgi:hypothetical protein
MAMSLLVARRLGGLTWMAGLTAVLAIAAVVVPLRAAPRPASRIPEVGATDAVVACGTKVLGKPVFLTSNSKFFDKRFTCPESREAFAPAMRTLGLRVFESAEGVVLIPEWSFEEIGNGMYYAWTHLTVRMTIDAFEQVRRDGPIGQPLTPDEQQHIAQTIYRSARTPPLGAFTMGPEAANTTISETVPLTLGAVTLKPGVRSILALWGDDEGRRRLVYGEMVQGQYTFLWDSPVLSGHRASLSFEDVDGDGVREIAFASLFGRYDMLVSIFTRAGVELTRQADCLTDWVNHKSRKPTAVCPVVGEQIDLQPAVAGKRDLLVETRDDSYRLVLKGNRYVRRKP